MLLNPFPPLPNAAVYPAPARHAGCRSPGPRVPPTEALDHSSSEPRAGPCPSRGPESERWESPQRLGTWAGIYRLLSARLSLVGHSGCRPASRRAPGRTVAACPAWAF